MRELPLEGYVEAVAGELARNGHEAAAEDRDRLARGCEIAQEKAQTLGEVWPLIRFLFEPPIGDEAAWAKWMGPPAAPRLEAALEAIAGVEERSFDAEALEAALGPLVDRLEIKARDLYQPIRVAITGTTVSPGIFDTLAALGRAPTLERLEAALARIARD